MILSDLGYVWHLLDVKIFGKWACRGLFQLPACLFCASQVYLGDWGVEGRMQCSLGSNELISEDGCVWAREKGALVWVERRYLNFIDGVGLSYDSDQDLSGGAHPVFAL
jgi:hypothetical protein